MYGGSLCLHLPFHSLQTLDWTQVMLFPGELEVMLELGAVGRQNKMKSMAEFVGIPPRFTPSRSVYL
jgi:hypothetical protein